MLEVIAVFRRTIPFPSEDTSVKRVLRIHSITPVRYLDTVNFIMRGSLN